MFSERAGSSPRRYFTNGVFSETFAGRQSEEEKPGIKRYSLKVREGSEIKVAIYVRSFAHDCLFDSIAETSIFRNCLCGFSAVLITMNINKSNKTIYLS